MVLIHERVAVDRIRTEMLMFKVAVEPKQLFPFDDGQRRVERVQIRDLDVAGILVVTRKMPPRASSVRSIPMPTSMKGIPHSSSFATISFLASPLSMHRNT